MSKQIDRLIQEIEKTETKGFTELLTFHCHNEYREWNEELDKYDRCDAFLSYSIKNFREDYPNLRENVFTNFCLSFGEKYSELHEDQYMNRHIHFGESEEELIYTFREELEEFVKQSRNNPLYRINRTPLDQIDLNAQKLEMFK